MRTLYEIIEDAKGGNVPTHEECYWVMLCFNVLVNSDHRRLQEELLIEKRSPEFIRKMKADNSHNAYRTALNKPPKDYLGPNNDLSSPEYQRFRKIGNKIVDKFIKPSNS